MAGGWTNNNLDEITAPGSVPFTPGQDVIGIGSQVPAELSAIGIRSALVMFNSSWTVDSAGNPTKTVPTTKFQFIASNGGSIVSGIGYSNNPSTTAVTVKTLKILGEAVQGAGVASLYEEEKSVVSAAERTLHVRAEVARGLDENWLDPITNNRLLNLAPTALGFQWNFYEPATSNLQMQYDPSNQLLQFVSDTKGLGTWRTVTFVNGWTATPSPSFGRPSGVQVRRLPTGVVHMRGTATPGITAAGTYIAQLPNSDFWPGAGLIIPVYSVGSAPRIVVDSGNGAITLLAGGTPATEMSFDGTWSVLL